MNSSSPIHTKVEAPSNIGASGCPVVPNKKLLPSAFLKDRNY